MSVLVAVALSALSLHVASVAAPRALGVRMEAAPVRFEVCQSRHCKRKGSAATLALMQEAAAGRADVLVEAADMSHTEHGW